MLPEQNAPVAHHFVYHAVEGLPPFLRRFAGGNNPLEGVAFGTDWSERILDERIVCFWHQLLIILIRHPLLSWRKLQGSTQNHVGFRLSAAADLDGSSQHALI